MQLLFIGIGLMSLVMLYYSIKYLIKSYRCKTIIEFPLDSIKHELEFKTIGLYSFCFIGAKHVSNDGTFNAMIYNRNNVSVRLNTSFPNYTFRKKGIYGIEFYKFRIKEAGRYTLQLTNHTGLKVNQSMLPIGRLLQNDSDTSHLKVRIKQTISSWERFVSIVGLVLGVNGLAWGIMIGVFNVFSN